MNRFSGTTPSERKSLVVAAIQAHRERESPFLTLEVGTSERSGTEGDDGPPPWIQYRDQDAQLNLDCTDSELDTIRSVVEEMGGVQITDQEAVDGGGTNLRLSVPGDDERVAHVIEVLFRAGFDRPENVRLWAAAI